MRGAGGTRAHLMVQRVVREARDRGVAGDLLERALALAMEIRVGSLPDEHHPALLHPGRTVLVLLGDTPEREEGRLAAAALAESLDPSLAVDPAEARRALGAAVADFLDGIPGCCGRGGSGGPLEELLDAPVELSRVALAERLDHLRHLHLNPDPEVQSLWHSETVELWLPVASRVDGVLGRRYAWWCRQFGRRLLGGARPPP